MSWVKKILLFLFTSRKAKIPTAPIAPPVPTKTEKWQAYAESLVIESGIDLENVLVHNHGGWGLAGAKAYKFENYCVTFESRDLGKLKFPLPLPDKPYIMVPEITGWWSFSAWIHEIGHYTHKHYEDVKKPKFMKEYEAEKFCLDKVKESGLVDSYDFIDFKYSSIGYLDSYIDKAIKDGTIKCYADIPEEVVKFLHQCNYMKDELINKFIKMREEYEKSQKQFNMFIE